MGKINTGRLLLGGVAAGIVMFLADGFIHEVLLRQLWLDTMSAAGRSVAEEESHRARDMAFFAVHELLRAAPPHDVVALRDRAHARGRPRGRLPLQGSRRSRLALIAQEAVTPRFKGRLICPSMANMP